MMMAAERAVESETVAKKAFGPNPDMQRLVDLYASLIDAYEAEVIETTPVTVADRDVFNGVEEQLKALCIRVKG